MLTASGNYSATGGSQFPSILPFHTPYLTPSHHVFILSQSGEGGEETAVKEEE